ncbi:MAG: hypothetical protein MHMPM18_001253 [Marteilia pararefringens]
MSNRVIYKAKKRIEYPELTMGPSKLLKHLRMPDKSVSSVPSKSGLLSSNDSFWLLCETQDHMRILFKQPARGKGDGENFDVSSFKYVSIPFLHKIDIDFLNKDEKNPTPLECNDSGAINEFDVHTDPLALISMVHTSDI